MENLHIVIENPKGTYKSFQTEGDPIWETYPLKGVTYPVDYGYIEGYMGEDNAELDIFVGTGTLCGYIRVWRLDVPEETKIFKNLTDEELQQVLTVFAPVLRTHAILDEKDLLNMLRLFKIIE
jgi:hypothetical protein